MSQSIKDQKQAGYFLISIICVVLGFVKTPVPWIPSSSLRRPPPPPCYPINKVEILAIVFGALHSLNHFMCKLGV